MTHDHIKYRRGVYASPRQPQGDFGRGSDHAQLGSSDDVNRELNERGAYRDAEPAQDPTKSLRSKTPGHPAPASAEMGPPSGTRPRPRRAGPLHPDRPGQGDERLKTESDPAQTPEESARKKSRQSKDALDNVRDGYGR